MTNTLVIDTSYGSTVGIVGHDPIVETDSRTHVERLQANIARAANQAGLEPQNISRIVVGIGPAPFTGLRAGIVTAKALAYATGAELVGQDVLTPQHRLMRLLRSGDYDGNTADEKNTDGTNDDSVEETRHLTLAVNDARRRQLYFSLLADNDGDDAAADANYDAIRTLIDKDIDYPANIVERVNHTVAQLEADHSGVRYVVDVAGHGAAKYADAWSSLSHVGMVTDRTLLDTGRDGLAVFAEFAEHEANTDVEPLYLRRPDVSVPRPLKQVLNHGAADKAA